MSNSAERAARAGRAFLAAVEEDHEMGDALSRTRAKLAEAAETVQANLAEGRDFLETSLHLGGPESAEDWKHAAGVAGIPYDVRKAGDFTYADVVDEAAVLADRQCAIARMAADAALDTETPAKTRKKKRPATPRGGADDLVWAGLLAIHEYDDGIIGNGAPASTRELAQAAGVSVGKVSAFFGRYFGGKAAYDRLCHRDKAGLEAKLRLALDGPADRFSGGGDALDYSPDRRAVDFNHGEYDPDA